MAAASTSTLCLHSARHIVTPMCGLLLCCSLLLQCLTLTTKTGNGSFVMLSRLRETTAHHCECKCWLLRLLATAAGLCWLDITYAPKLSMLMSKAALPCSQLQCPAKTSPKHAHHRHPLVPHSSIHRCAATTKSTQSVEGTPDPETVQRAQPSASVVEGQGEVELQHNKPKPSPSPPPTGPSSSPCAADSMNVPWIAGEVAGTITVQRTLKSVLSSKEGRLTFKAAGSADAGSSFTVEVSPKSFKVGGSKHKSKRQQTVTITVKPTSSTAMATPQFGQVRRS